MYIIALVDFVPFTYQGTHFPVIFMRGTSLL